jgi:hypothetical protein
MCASNCNVAKLCRLDYTAVTRKFPNGSSWLWRYRPQGGAGITFWMQGSGESQWRDDHLAKLSEIVDVGVMQTLDIDFAYVEEG